MFAINKVYSASIVFLLTANTTLAASISVPINNTASPQSLGEITFTDSPHGLLITPNLTQLPPGLHGLHLHQHPSCANHGNDAGSHFDPQQTNSHQGPYANGHLGDLPVLYATADGKANVPTLAPRLKVSDLSGLTVMIHANGDNYSDNPPLGGGGAREACGVVTP